MLPGFRLAPLALLTGAVLLFRLSSAMVYATPPVQAATAEPTSVKVSGPAVLTVGATSQFSAVVVGVSDQSVTWKVNGVAGGSSQYGMIARTGVYTPPSVVPSANKITVSATSNDDSVISGSLSATILYPAPVVTAASSWTSDTGHTFVVNVYGSNIIPGATLLIAGKPVAANALAQNDLQTTYSNSSGTATKIVVSVQNPGPAVSVLSNTLSVTLTPTVVSPTAAARFLDQISFGPTAASLANVEQIGLTAALAQQFSEPISLYSQPPVGDPECLPSNGRCTQSQFLDLAAWGGDQLRQRVAMALSELWVAPSTLQNAMPAYLNTLARDAFTNYRTIMQDATLSPNMGSYLNMLNSVKAPVGQVPNENFAREVMQLFTMGPNLLNPDGTLQTDAHGNPIPAYTEAQVQAFARAYTGWTYGNAQGVPPANFTFTQDWVDPMLPIEFKHDTTAKVLLNGTTLPAGQTAVQDLSGALDNVFTHPNVGPFVSRQLIQHLVEGNPSPAYVQRVAAVFDNNGKGVRGDMKAVLTAIFMDPEARAGDVQTADQADSNPEYANAGHLREPLLWTVNVVRALNATKANLSMTYPFGSFMGGQLGLLAEEPFSQPSVFNYFSPSFVAPMTSVVSPEFGIENTGTIVPRLDRADGIIHNGATELNVDLSATSLIGQNAAEPAQLVDYLSMLFMHNQMPTSMRNVLIDAVTSIPATALQERAEVAVYLVITSSQYKILH